MSQGESLNDDQLQRARGKKVSIIVDRDPVNTSFEKWGQPGHFSRTLAKGPKTTTWIWNLHADAHDFDSHTSSLEDVSRKILLRISVNYL